MIVDESVKRCFGLCYIVLILILLFKDIVVRCGFIKFKFFEI